MRYQAVNVQKDLIEKIKGVVLPSRIGYRSITEFVNEAVRIRLEQLIASGVLPKATPMGAGGAGEGSPKHSPPKARDEGRKKPISVGVN